MATNKKTGAKVEVISQEIPLRIVLVAPPSGVDFGIQHGKGNNYTTILTQRSDGTNLTFEFSVTGKVKAGDDLLNFIGPLSQGPASGRFIYIDIGKYAGQTNSCWARRIKVPLNGITCKLIDNTLKSPKLILEAQLPGTGKDGGPSCATIKPIDGWKCCNRSD